jgi:alpha-galactosidase
MSNRISYIFGLLLLIISVSCKEKVYEDVFVGEPTGTKLEALGAELDPHFFSQNLTRNDGSKASDWQYVVSRVKNMELQKFRVMALPQWYEPVNDDNNPHETEWDKFAFESPEMQSLYKVLDLAQAQNIDVCIVLWGCPVGVSLLDEKYAHAKTCFMADTEKKGVWITGPVDYDEWAENFSTLIKYLIEKKGYTCVNEITPMNEPDGGPLLTSTEYIKMARVLDARFRKDGIRDRVKFNLSDNTDTRTFYLADCAENLSDVADVFNSHTYIFGYNVANDSIFNWEKNNVEIAARAGKEHLIGEFGSNQCVGATRQRDIDSYARGVLMTRMVLNFFNAGAAGVSYWSLIDQYYGKDADYQQMQQLGLWKYVKEAYRTDTTYNKIEKDYEVRPQYYSYSLLTRFIKPGAEVYPIDLNDDFSIGSAFRSTNGKWTYVFANATSSIKSVAINNSLEEGTFDIFRYEENTLPEDDDMIPSHENITVNSRRLCVDVRPNTVVLCQQK